MKRAAMVTVAAAALIGAPAPAAAFHPPASFEATANDGGGSGQFFTGSPRQKGYDCSICHVDPAEQISATVTLTPDPGGAYTPGAVYTVDVAMIGEHRGFGSVANENTFLTEVVDDQARTAGSFVEVDPTRWVLIDDDRVLGTRAGQSIAWSFAWRAPAAGAGPVTLYLGMVDGDGASDPTRGATDPIGDDVATAALRLCEGAPGCAARPERPLETSPAGCAAAGGGGGALVVLLALGWLGLAWRRRARRGRRRVARCLAAAALAANATACFDPSVPAECPDRVCGGDASVRDDGTCRESWTCGPWSAPPGSDQATRECVDRNQLGTTACKPSEGPVTLPALDFDFYQCRVQPILQRACSMMGCHGTEVGRSYRIYARGRLRNDQIVDRTGTCIPMTGQVNLREAGTGTVMCEGWLPHTADEWKKNFDSARSFMLDVTEPADSDLLLMPVAGGKPHAEIKPFRADSPDYQTIREWLAGARLGQPCTPEPN